MNTTKRIVLAAVVSVLAFGAIPAQQATAAPKTTYISSGCCR
jgi:hypothetical protein